MRGAALWAMAFTLAAGGCSVGADDEPKPATGATREIGTVVGALERATAGQDFRAICDDLFTAAARRRAGGRDCRRLLRESARDVRRPQIEVLGIEIERGRARVKVRTRAEGQRPLADVIELRRERGGYRIESLAAG
jgi:hypothetical protein